MVTAPEQGQLHEAPCLVRVSQEMSAPQLTIGKQGVDVAKGSGLCPLKTAH